MASARQAEHARTRALPHVLRFVREGRSAAGSRGWLADDLPISLAQDARGDGHVGSEVEWAEGQHFERLRSIVGPKTQIDTPEMA